MTDGTVLQKDVHFGRRKKKNIVTHFSKIDFSFVDYRKVANGGSVFEIYFDQRLYEPSEKIKKTE